MLELLVNGMIIRSNTYRNITFKSGEVTSIDFDDNLSQINVSYVRGTPNLVLSNLIPNCRVVKESEVTIEGTYQIDFSPIVINGIKFHELKHGIKITQVIVKGNVESQVVYQEPLGIGIVINVKDLNIEVDKYLELINSSEYIYAEVEDENEFFIANFTSVGFQYRDRKYQFNNVYPYTNEVIYTDEIIIIDGLLNYLESIYPQFRFKLRPIKQNDETLLPKDDNSPNETIWYKVNLAKEKDSLGTRPLPDTEYDTIRNAVIEVQFEYTSDDLNSTMKFREDFIMQREFSNKRNYKYKDTSGKDWDASVWWESHENTEVPKKPDLEPEESPLLLNSFRFQANVLGIICRYKLTPSIVTKAILRLIVSDDNKILVDVEDENGSSQSTS